MMPYFDQNNVTLYNGDCREVLASMPPASVNCCVTSPPYWGLRDYGHASQIGLEQTPDAYVAEMVAVFREVRRVLRDDGTLWLNLGDSYNAGREGGHAGGKNGVSRPEIAPARSGVNAPGLKPKDLVGIPWLVAFALRADGWYLRSDIIWHKPNPMPESVTDRPTKAHEYLFLMSKSERYYYDADAIAEPITESSIERLSQPTLADQVGSDRVPGKTNGNMKAVGPRFGGSKYGDNDDPKYATKSGNVYVANGLRNKRSVWTVTTQPYSQAHFATFPPKLIEPCILAGCPDGGVVLDPFFGAGTTGVVCQSQHVRCIGIELNTEYCGIAARRLAQGTLFTTKSA